MQYLRADTNVEVLVGPVVAVGDGFTPVTTLSLSTADEAELIKYNGTSALVVTSISANAMTAITGADGYYTLDLSTGNTDTEGFLTVLINDDSLCLPVRMDFMVVNANVYDSLFAAATTDYLQVDTLQLAGTTQDATDLADFAAAGYNPVTKKVTGVVLVDTTTTNTDMRGTDSAYTGTPPTAAAVADAVWDEAKAGHVGVGSFGEEVQLHALSSEVSSLNDLDAAGIRTAVGLAAADLDTQLAALPTAAENADKILGRSIAGGADGGRTVKDALRFLRNKWSVSGTTLTVTAEDDTTTAWTSTLGTDAAADPVVSSDPA